MRRYQIKKRPGRRLLPERTLLYESLQKICQLERSPPVHAYDPGFDGSSF